ncbi:hypothetical protein PIB30_001572 [Stylosanthes scabra]|uniref:Uncharacterized protein n=1 Tax=Stylosanthes scabra TaxID=79078 RepID=A0ABU6R385_9FABA|nr:hypothetical protein [Stylosanthes scabra]
MADKILSASKDEKSSTERPRSSRHPSPHYSPRTMPVAQQNVLHHLSRVLAPSAVTPKRTFNIISKIWDVLINLLLFVAAKLLYPMSQWRPLTDSLLVAMVRATTCPKSGSHSRRVRVLRVPRLLEQ